jgi:hypothetical protein
VKQTYRILAGLVVLGVLVQAAAIAFAWFDVLHQVDGGAVFDGNAEGNAGHAIHGIVGMAVVPAIALILLIVSFFANKVLPGAAKWGGIVFGLTVLQVALAFASFGAPVVGALHGINALLLAAAAGRAMALARTTRVDNEPAGVSVPV